MTSKKIYPITQSGHLSDLAQIEEEALKHPHTSCKFCNEPIWFGLVQLRYKEFWRPFQVSEHKGKPIIDGDGFVSLIAHNCRRHKIEVDRRPTYQVKFDLGTGSGPSYIDVDAGYDFTHDKEKALAAMENYRADVVDLVKGKFPDCTLELIERKK